MKKVLIPAVICGLVLGVTYLFPSITDDSNAEINSSPQVKTITETSEYSELIAILAVTNSSERDYRLQQFFTGYISESPYDAIEMIKQLDNLPDRQVSYKIAMLIWHNTDMRSLLEWLENETPDPSLDIALVELSQMDLLEMKYGLTYAEKIFDDRIQETQLSRLISDWVLIDPEKIVLWSTNSNQRDAWLSLAFKILTIDSIDSAINALSALETGTPDQRYIAIQTIIDNYRFGKITPETITLMQSLIPYEIREEVIGALLQLIAQEEWVTLDDLNTLLNSLLPGSIQDAYHEQVALNWAIKDPVEAAKYAQTLTGSARELALNGVVTSWIQTDLEATDEWLKTLDGNLDLAANTIGRGSAKLGNIAIADNWINHIEDEKIRTEAIIDVIDGWYEESPEAGIYHLVYQKSLTSQQKLDMLHQIYPGEVFITPEDALNDIGRLEGLQSPF